MMRVYQKGILCGIAAVAALGMMDVNGVGMLNTAPVEVQAAEADENGFVIQNGVITEYNGEGESVTIPDGVTSIGENAFWNCESLTSVKLSDSVTSIGGWAFSYCDSLVSIEIPDSVTSIGESAFLDCESLTSVKIPNSVTSIGEDVFSDCENLTGVEISSSVTGIGKGMFSGCTSLKSIEIPNSVTSIGEEAFSGCESLTDVEIPSSVASIGDDAFSGCENLVSIKIPSSVTSIGNSTFEGISENFIIYCVQNSYAQKYAKEKGFHYVIQNIEDKETTTENESSGGENAGTTEGLRETSKGTLQLKKKKILIKKGQKAKVKLLSNNITVSYESKNPSIASVNSKGTVTGKKAGKTVILVKAGGETAKVKVTVKATANNTSANTILLNKNRTLSKKSVSMKKGTKLTIQKASGISGKVIFKSLNKKIATVSVKGVVKARKKGRTDILVKNGGKSVKLKVTVKR